MTLRTFIALELPENHKAAILHYLDTWRKLYRNGINWVSPENLHLTLAFLGDTDSNDLPHLQEMLFKLTHNQPGFNLSLCGFELFPAREPRLLWVKLASTDQGIFTFSKELNRALKEAGLSPDAKPLKLHVTAGRIKLQQPSWLEQEFMQSALPNEAAEYNTITFYQSVLRPVGPVYTPLRQFDLRHKAY